MLSAAPPQGSGKAPPISAETIIGNVQNASYNANNSIFGAALEPVIPSGNTIEWTVYFAFDGNQAVLEHSLDNGATFATTFEDITTNVGYSVKIVVAVGDQVIFRFSKSGTIIYCRVGQPL